MIVLILSSLFLVYGIVFFGWNPANVFMAYWLESLVIGSYAVLKIVNASEFGDLNLIRNGKKLANNKKNALVAFGTTFGLLLFFALGFYLILLGSAKNFDLDGRYLLLYAAIAVVVCGFEYYQDFVVFDGQRDTVAEIMSGALSRTFIMLFALWLAGIVEVPTIGLVIAKVTTDIFSYALKPKKYSLTIKMYL